jgi:salicylate hydroxylase
VGVDALLAAYKGFHPSLLAVLAKGKNVKKWPLLYRPPVPRWFKGRLVLVGDAVHPMLPHQGQAGAQAIEDAVALGMFLDGITKLDLEQNPEMLNKRLKMFEKVRSKRAAAIQIFSNAGQDQAEKVKDQVKQYVEGHIPSNPQEFLDFNFGYDIKAECQKLLKEESRQQPNQRVSVL